MSVCLRDGVFATVSKKKLQRLLPPCMKYAEKDLSLVAAADIPPYSILYKFEVEPSSLRKTILIIPIQMQSFVQALNANSYIMKSNLGFYLVSAETIKANQPITIIPSKHVTFTIDVTYSE